MRFLDRATGRLPKPWRTLIDWAVTIGLAVAVVLGFEAEIAKPYRIPSASMEPTLHCAGENGCLAHTSDRVIANRLAYRFRSPHRGEIVVFNTPPAARRSGCGGGTFVKRLIGLPGETWSERNGAVYIDGKLLAEPYLLRRERDTETHTAVHIADGRYFMMGDNRNSSCDSRVWGTVPRSGLIGPVVLTYWPPSRIGTH